MGGARAPREALVLFMQGTVVTIGLKRHHPARGRVGAEWRPKSGFNNAVLSTADCLEYKQKQARNRRQSTQHRATGYAKTFSAA